MVMEGPAMRDIGRVDESPEELRRIGVRRAERSASMAAQSWPAFWRDLGVRFLIAGGIAAVAAAALWLFVR